MKKRAIMMMVVTGLVFWFVSRGGVAIVADTLPVEPLGITKVASTLPVEPLGHAIRR